MNAAAVRLAGARLQLPGPADHAQQALRGANSRSGSDEPARPDAVAACFEGPGGILSTLSKGAVVIDSIPPYSLAVGCPARVIRRLREEDVHRHVPGTDVAVST